MDKLNYARNIGQDFGDGSTEVRHELPTGFFSDADLRDLTNH
jgi:hypothetical protein